MEIHNSIITNKQTTSPYQPIVKGGYNHDWHVFGVDEGGAPVRDYIRRWREEHYFPYQDIYEKEGRMSEYKLNRTLSHLVRKPQIVDNEILNQLNIPALVKHEEGIYRGAIINADSLKKVEKLHEAGIRNIIKIGENSPALKRTCEKFGINYMDIDFFKAIDDKMGAFRTIEDIKYNAQDQLQYAKKKGENIGCVDDAIKTWQVESRAFIDKFTRFIQTMQKGNVFLGCNNGREHTGVALIFENLFNPANKQRSLYNAETGYLMSCNTLYRNLTEADKLKMGWTKAFDGDFIKKLAEYLPSYLRHTIHLV